MPLNCPSPSSPPPCRCAIHRRCYCAVHYRHCRCVAVAPSIAVATVPSITGSIAHCHRAAYHRCYLLILLFVIVNSSPLLPYFLLVIIADLFRLIAVSIDCASIGGDGRVFVCVPPNWGQWHCDCHCCSCRCAPLLFAGGAMTTRQLCQLASFPPYLDAQHSFPTCWEVVFTEVATDMNTKR